MNVGTKKPSEHNYSTLVLSALCNLYSDTSHVKTIYEELEFQAFNFVPPLIVKLSKLIFLQRLRGSNATAIAVITTHESLSMTIFYEYDYIRPAARQSPFQTGRYQ